MRQIIPSLAVGASLLTVLNVSSAQAQTTIATNGKSTFVVVLPASAPLSIQNAAKEFCTDIQLATGVILQIQKDDQAITGPFISLGATKQAVAAKVSVEGLEDDAFRIVTKDGSLYITGPDTPNGGWTKQGGLSNGTANGVYTFLQDYLGVRWLMPGDLGRDVPAKPTLTLPNLNRTETPRFGWRRVTHLWDYSDPQQRRTILEWQSRQKLGGTVEMDYDHNWWRAINDNKTDDVNTPAVRALYQEHPDWFAMDATGKRPFPANSYAKFETTNPELVKWFADKAVKAIKASPKPRTYSLSPADGNSWSQSPETKALLEPNPSSAFDPEVPASQPVTTSLVLKWYHEVAEIVEREYPEGQLTGYIYASYVYPPTKYKMQLPKNFTPVICGIGTYGYGLYREDNRQRYQWVMDSWSKVMSKGWYYYDLPNQILRQHESEIGDLNFPGSTGIVTPAAPEILDTIFPTLTRNKILGAYIYGVPSWSNAAMSNYMLAQMEWNPNLKAADIQKEWLSRAYGPKAGSAMEKFYGRLNSFVGDYVRTHTGNGELLTADMLKVTYADNYPELERLFLAAKVQPMSKTQAARLQLIEENLIVLQWRLRNAGLLASSVPSQFRRDDEQVNAVLTRYNADFPMFPGALSFYPWYDQDRSKALPWKVGFKEVALTDPAPVTKPHLTDGQFLIHAVQDGDIRVTPKNLNHGPYFAAFELRDEAGKVLETGIWRRGKSLIIPAKAGGTYSLLVPPRKGVNYELVVEGAALATAGAQDKVVTLQGQGASAYVYYESKDDPIGAFKVDGGVTLKKPFSGSVAPAIMGDAYKNIRVLASLDDGWKFSPDPKDDGLQRGVLESKFDDSSWKTVTAMDWWQMQGFPDYHGVGWYRIKFTLDDLPKTDRARLYFGAIDGNAVVYLNGKKLMEHNLGEGFKGWNLPFSNNAGDLLVPGENLVTVKVSSKNTTTATGIFKGAALFAGTRKP